MDDETKLKYPRLMANIEKALWTISSEGHIPLVMILGALDLMKMRMIRQMAQSLPQEFSTRPSPKWDWTQALTPGDETDSLGRPIDGN